MFETLLKKEVATGKEVKKEEEALFKIELQKEIPSLPDFKNKEETDIRYPLIEPYAYAHIHWDSNLQEVMYEIEEPKLEPREKNILKIVEDGIKELINISFISIKEGDIVIRYLEKNIKILLAELGFSLSKETFLKIMYYVYRDFVGLNEFEPLMNDYFIEDIECNGINSPVYLVHRKYRNLKTNIVFADVLYLASFVEKLAQKCGRYVSYSSPLLDGSLPSGHRVNATYTTDISSKGPTITIRAFTKEPWSPSKMIDLGTVSPEILAYLWMLVEHEFNIMVIGGTGSGKTSFLNALAFFIPQQARIVSIEDTRELNLVHENWLPSVAREGIGLANIVGQKYGEVTLFDLLKESFRQRPDYVIIGEVRGKEAFVLFQGMASIPGNEEIFVLDDNKFKKIKIKDIKGNTKKYKIITINPNTLKLEIAPIKNFFRHKPRKILYKIETEKGKEIITTGDHSVFIYTNKIIPMAVKDLKKGDSIASVNIKSDVGKSNIISEKIKFIKKIKLERPESVYDLSIQGTQNFVSGSGILLHNSGHPSLGTMHANDVQTMIRRLETEPINLSPSLVESMDAICIMTQAKLGNQEVRRLKQVVEIISVPEEVGKAQVNIPFQWDPRTDTFFFKTDSYIFQKLTTEYGFTKDQLINEFELRTRLLYELYQRKIFDFRKVQEIINEYARSPKKVLKDYGLIK